MEADGLLLIPGLQPQTGSVTVGGKRDFARCSLRPDGRKDRRLAWEVGGEVRPTADYAGSGQPTADSDPLPMYFVSITGKNEVADHEQHSFSRPLRLNGVNYFTDYVRVQLRLNNELEMFPLSSLRSR